jgi:dihydrofolate reductase
MGELRYSINLTVDGCCDHRVIPADEQLHRHAVETLQSADALLFGRTTYELMKSAFHPTELAENRPDFMEPFAQEINAAKKYVVSRTLKTADWNTEIVVGNLREVI